MDIIVELHLAGVVSFRTDEASLEDMFIEYTGAGVLVVYLFGELALDRFVLFVLLTLVFGILWCGLGLARRCDQAAGAGSRLSAGVDTSAVL